MGYQKKIKAGVWSFFVSGVSGMLMHDALGGTFSKWTVSKNLLTSCVLIVLDILTILTIILV